MAPLMLSHWLSHSLGGGIGVINSIIGRHYLLLVAYPIPSPAGRPLGPSELPASAEAPWLGEGPRQLQRLRRAEEKGACRASQKTKHLHNPMGSKGFIPAYPRSRESSGGSAAAASSPRRRQGRLRLPGARRRQRLLRGQKWPSPTSLMLEASPSK